MLTLILLVFAFVLVAVSAFIAPAAEPWRWRLAWCGVACWILSELLANGAALATHSGLFAR
jgi:hypothetical protein